MRPFGNAWYKNFPGVTLYKEGLLFQNIIKNAPQKKDVELTFNNLMASSHDGVVDRAYTGLVANFNIEENAANTAKTLEKLIFKKTEATFPNLK